MLEVGIGMFNLGEGGAIHMAIRDAASKRFI
jgi:hypothetical protein